MQKLLSFFQQKISVYLVINSQKTLNTLNDALNNQAQIVNSRIPCNTYNILIEIFHNMHIMNSKSRLQRYKFVLLGWAEIPKQTL